MWTGKFKTVLFSYLVYFQKFIVYLYIACQFLKLLPASRCETSSLDDPLKVDLLQDPKFQDLHFGVSKIAGAPK